MRREITKSETTRHTVGHEGYCIRVPRLQEDKVDIDNYLTQFEQIAEDQEWPQESCAKHLKLQLLGKARTAVNKMEMTASRDYDRVKAKILKGYELTAEAYRQRFRSSKRKGNDTYTQWKVQSAKVWTIGSRPRERPETTSAFEKMFCVNTSSRMYPVK